MKLSKKQSLKKRHIRVRKSVAGTAERPRLYVRRSLKHLYAQLIVDGADKGSRTLATFTTATKDNRGKDMSSMNHARVLGKNIGSELKARGIETIVYDRGGYRYHGVVKVLAESVREAGINF